MDTLHIGQIITTEQHRDAVHMAIVPVVAGDLLQPGQHVGLKSGRAVRPSKSIKTVGIVDPFLVTGPIGGERFWLFLYPGSITSLRHDWTHPAFKEEAPKPAPMGRDEAWLRSFAEDEAHISYEELLDGTKEHLAFDEYMCEGDKWDGFILPDEFWDHYGAVTGTKIPDDRRYSFFSCSC